MENNKLKILYVDDEQINLDLLSSILYREYEIHTVLTPMEGLELLKNQKIDLIITDQKMPDMTGVEFLEEVHKIYPTIPPHRIMTSGYSKPDSIDKAFEQFNLCSFIEKPWNIIKLKKTINEVINMKINN